MVRLTIDLDDDVVGKLREMAGDGAPIERLAALLLRHRVREIGPPDGALADPPPEVLREIRRRQQTPLSESVPVDEAHDQIVRRLRERDAAEQAAQKSSISESAD